MRPPPFHLRRGTTLVELMIAMLILAIVCVGWLEIIGIQSARREARRREAVERLAGMMDAFMYFSKTGSIVVNGKSDSLEVGKNYSMGRTGENLTVTLDANTSDVHPLFDTAISPVGYQLCVVKTSTLPNSSQFGSNWGEKKWLVGKLYDYYGTKDKDPFFTLPVCLGL